MKNRRRIFAALLTVALLLTLLAACAKSDGQTDTPVEAETPENNEQPATAPEQTQPEEQEPDQGEITEITVTYLDMYNKGETAGQMVAALNEITEKEIGVHVNFEFWDMGSFGNQMTLALSGGTQIDLVMVSPLTGSNYATLLANGSLMDISSYLKENYASDIMAAVGDQLGAYTIGDAIYGVPPLRDTAVSSFIVMRADVLDELGMREKAENMTTWAEFEEILRAVKANTELSPITLGRYV